MIRLATALLALSTTAYAETYRVPVDRTMGGSIDAYVDIINDLNQRRVHVVIDVPACSSACTFYILADSVCVSARTNFGFHGPQGLVMSILGLPIQTLSKERRSFVVGIMAANYNMQYPGLGDWFKERAAHKFGWAQTFVKGQSLHDSFGVPLCPLKGEKDEKNE